MARETPARRKIREAAERNGRVIEEMAWEPIGAMVEMSGREGGWYVQFEDGGHALGYCAEDVVEWIDREGPLTPAETHKPESGT